MERSLYHERKYIRERMYLFCTCLQADRHCRFPDDKVTAIGQRFPDPDGLAVLDENNVHVAIARHAVKQVAQALIARCLVDTLRECDQRVVFPNRLGVFSPCR